MEVSPELLLGGAGIIIGIVLAVFGPTGKYVGERRYGAEKRANLIHSHMIGDLQLVIDAAEGMDYLKGYYGKIRDSRYVSLLLSEETRKQLSEWVEALSRYSGARDTCIKIVKAIMNNELDTHLKKTQLKIIEEELWKGKGYENVESLFASIAPSFGLRVIRKQGIDIDWLKEIVSPFFPNDIKESTVKGESLEKFLSDVEREIQQAPATEWLREERDRLSGLSKKCKEMIELESKTLYSWKGFFYGWGRKTIVEDLEREGSKLKPQYR